MNTIKRNRLVIFAACMLAAAAVSLIASSQRFIALAALASYDVQIASQPNSPLAITSHAITAPRGSEVAIDLVVINTFDKVISSFSIRHDVILEGGSFSNGTTLNIANADRGTLAPGGWRTVSVGASKYSEQVTRVILSVDFVEFTDGTAWGEDKEKSAELLAGRRAGAKAAKDRLSEKLKKEGEASVVAEVERAAAGDDLQPLAEKSLIFKRGYTNGVKSIYSRVRHVNSKKGVKKIKEAIEEPSSVVEEN